MRDLHIQSSQFELPQQYDTLKALCRCLRNGINREFFVIGATARDLLSVAMQVKTSKRTTKDLDICIAVESWDCFAEIQQKLVDAGLGDVRLYVRGADGGYKQFSTDDVLVGKGGQTFLSKSLRGRGVRLPVRTLVMQSDDISQIRLCTDGYYRKDEMDDATVVDVTIG